VTPEFDGHYDHWSMLMENFLRSIDMWNLVSVGISSSTIGTSSTSEIMETILDKSTSKAILDLMKQKYQGSTKVKRAQLQALRKKFEMLNMKEGKKIDNFMARTLIVVNKMKVNGENMPSSTMVSKVLRSLTPKLNYVVCSIE